jgi:hypothetical protein
MSEHPLTHRAPYARAAALAALAFALVGAGCAVIPSGPSTMALPGSGRSFAQFRADEDACRRFALDRIGGQTAQRAANDSTAAGAIIGAAVGAAAGAAIGGSSGAGVGAGTGLVIGTVAGSAAGAGTGYDAQRRYDQAYVQCMYASGHKVPVAEGSFRPAPAPAAGARVPPLPPGVPPPPAGTPPAPPPAASVPNPQRGAAPPAPPLPPPGAPPPPPPSWRPG